MNIHIGSIAKLIALANLNEMSMHYEFYKTSRYLTRPPILSLASRIVTSHPF